MKSFEMVNLKILFAVLLISVVSVPALFGQESYISTSAEEVYFPLVSEQGPATIFVDEDDHKGVVRVARDLVRDVERVTRKLPELKLNSEEIEARPVIIGKLGKSDLIKRLVEAGKLDVSEIEGKWETFSIQTVDNPLPGVEQALVIVGSDKRGSIFGI